ncbi:MAG: transporter substrate-binding domain-containing protein [Pseudomonadota bacterium]
MRPRALISLFALVLAIALGTARADTLVVGTTGDYKPLTWYDSATNTFSGRDIDLIKAFADDEDLTLLFVPTTWPTLTADLLAGKFDVAIGGISRTRQRAQDALLSVTIEETGKVALVRCGEEDRYGSIEAIDQTGTTVVENRGGTNAQFALAKLMNAVLIIVPDNEQPFVYLFDKRADVMFTDSIEAVYQQQVTNGLLCAVKPDEPYTRVEKVAMFAKDEADLLARFNAWFEAR